MIALWGWGAYLHLHEEGQTYETDTLVFEYIVVVDRREYSALVAVGTRQLRRSIERLGLRSFDNLHPGIESLDPLPFADSSLEAQHFDFGFLL